MNQGHKERREGRYEGPNLEIIDMHLDSKGGLQTAIAEFWSLDLDITP